MAEFMTSLTEKKSSLPRPTKKQLEFASAISKSLGIELPKDKTRQSLFLFIRDNRPEYDRRFGRAPTLDDLDVDFDEAYCLGIDIYTGSLNGD